MTSEDDPWWPYVTAVLMVVLPLLLFWWLGSDSPHPNFPFVIG